MGMRNFVIGISFVVGLVFQQSDVRAVNTSIEKEMKQLVNYKRMSERSQAIFRKQRSAQIQAWEKYQIPKNFRIPVELQSYRPDWAIKYYAIYNPAYKTGVGYVPSDLSGLYEQEAWKAYQDEGSDAPSLSIVLAQQFTESAFNPKATGDNNKSHGLPQLYLNTAKFLYKIDKATWEKFFYFDKNGNQHFHNTRAMVRFPFVFLTKVKRYNAENKFDGIRRYNGAGDSAIKYAQKIMKRSLFYEELFAQYNALPLDTTGFRENLFGMINLTLLSRDEEPLSGEIMDDLFENALVDFYSGYVNQTYLNHYRIMSFEQKPQQIAKNNDYKMPVDGKDYYIIVEDGRTLYSYFKDPVVVLNTLNEAKNEDYFIYYKHNGNIVRVTNLKEVGDNQVFTNVKPGDKIYIPPGTIIRSPETNLAVVIN